MAEKPSIHGSAKSFYWQTAANEVGATMALAPTLTRGRGKGPARVMGADAPEQPTKLAAVGVIAASHVGSVD